MKMDACIHKCLCFLSIIWKVADKHSIEYVIFQIRRVCRSKVVHAHVRVGAYTECELFHNIFAINHTVIAIAATKNCDTWEKIVIDGSS